MGRIPEQTVEFLEDGALRSSLAKLLAIETHHAQETKNLERTKKTKPTFANYGMIFAVAILKDLLDCSVILAIPPLSTVLSLCAGFTIFVLLFLKRENYNLITSRFILLRLLKSRFARRILSLLVLMLAFLVEGLFVGVNLFPIQTLAVLIIFLMDRYLSNQQIEAITEILKLLEGRYVVVSREAASRRLMSPLLLSHESGRGLAAR